MQRSVLQMGSTVPFHQMAVCGWHSRESAQTQNYKKKTQINNKRLIEVDQNLKNFKLSYMVDLAV